MSWKVTAEPTVEPVTLAALKAQIRSDLNSEDEILYEYIQAARRFVENRLELAVIDQEITYKLDAFGRSRIALPRTNLLSVTSVSYTDEDGASQTLAASVYGADTFSNPGAIFLKNGQEWPTVLSQHQAVTIVYRAGWEDPSSVPTNIKQAILLLAAHWDDVRAPTMDKASSEVDFTVSALLNQARVIGL